MAVGVLDDTEVRKGILARQDTLMVIHLAQPSAGVKEDDSPRPRAFSLRQNYPNPFNASTAIAFAVDNTCHVTLTVFDVLGRYVTTITAGGQQAGKHTVRWDGTDKTGREVTSGVYFYRLTIGDQVETRKMLLLK